LLSGLGEWPLMIGATLLTAVNDNAAITYLASLVPDFSEPLKYAVVAGAVAGGGLTVIANAPNPAGQSILQKHFGEGGVSPLKLFLAALAPTLIMGAAFMLLR
jgi:Na+/H+ antiporter NhaD/arsenite permease-like protein